MDRECRCYLGYTEARVDGLMSTSASPRAEAVSRQVTATVAREMIDVSQRASRGGALVCVSPASLRHGSKSVSAGCWWDDGAWEPTRGAVSTLDRHEVLQSVLLVLLHGSMLQPPPARGQAADDFNGAGWGCKMELDENNGLLCSLDCQDCISEHRGGAADGKPSAASHLAKSPTKSPVKSPDKTPPGPSICVILDADGRGVGARYVHVHG